MSKKLLVVYNTCGISKNEKTDWYFECLDSICCQNFDKTQFDIVISACMNSDETQKLLMDRYWSTNMKFNFIHDKLTVNTTFNHTLQKCFDKEYYEGIVYVDSGVTFDKNDTILQQMYEKFKSGPYGMVTVQTDNDTGFPTCFGFERVVGEDFIVPVGAGCNCHLQVFDAELYRKFDRKVIPDVFVAYCTESTFSCLNSAIGRKWIIMKDLIVRHNKGVDGATSGFSHMGPYGVPWNNLFGGRNAMDFINDPECRECGMSYETCGNIMMPNLNAFDHNGFAKSKKLIQLIKKYWFLTQAELDYNNISHSFIDNK